MEETIGEKELIAHFTAVQRSIRKLSAHTLLAYEQDLAQFVLWAKTSLAIHPQECRREDAKMYVRHLTKEKQYSHATVNRKISCVKMFYTYLVREGHCQQNPFSLVAVHRQQSTLPDVLTVKEVATLLSLPSTDFPSLRDMSLFSLLYDTGCRISEVLALRERDVSWKENRILVVGKGRKTRYVFFTDYTKELLIRYVSSKRQLFDSEYLL
ncbi:MAG: recombinase XerC, partial [Spirochaetia bacterium]|nr:recombinase XerC [Spirochaetia bacterium]